MPEDRYLLVHTTFPSLEEARQIGTELVERQLAACVNLLPECESIYRWKGKIETAREIPAVIKTTDANYPELEATLQRKHPYETPEIVATRIKRGSMGYLAWMSEVTID